MNYFIKSIGENKKMKEKKKIYWGSYCSSELRKIVKKNPIVILPIGAYEQHGPHLPIDTDTHIGIEIAKKAVKISDYPSILLPSLWLGASEHHLDFCGTISLSYKSMKLIIHDITRSLSKHKIRKIILFNSHGGNISPLQCVVNEEGANLGIEIILITYWDLVRELVSKKRKSELGGISHGGELETSLKMYLAPDDVIEEKLEPNVVKGNSYYNPEMFTSNKINVYKPFCKLSSKGHIGDPTVASPEFGKSIFDNAVKELCKIIMLFGRGELC